MIFRYNFLTIIWILVIMGLTFTPGPSIPPLPKWDLISFDTFVHAFIFAVLVFLMSNSFKRSSKPNFFQKFPISTTLLISFVFGCMIEVIQPYIPGRTFDYYDIISNSTGCILGVIVLIIQDKYFPYSSHLSR